MVIGGAAERRASGPGSGRRSRHIYRCGRDDGPAAVAAAAVAVAVAVLC